MGNSPWGQLLIEKKKFHHKLNVGCGIGMGKNIIPNKPETVVD
jgi:hypothetical protein